MENRLTVKQAATLMGVSEQFVRVGLQQKVLTFGCAIKNKSKWSYFISTQKFIQETGIQIEKSPVAATTKGITNNTVQI